MCNFTSVPAGTLLLSKRSFIVTLKAWPYCCRKMCSLSYTKESPLDLCGPWPFCFNRAEASRPIPLSVTVHTNNSSVFSSKCICTHLSPCFGIRPCQIEFSTNGCTIIGGIFISSSSIAPSVLISYLKFTSKRNCSSSK